MIINYYLEKVIKVKKTEDLTPILVKIISGVHKKYLDSIC